MKATFRNHTVICGWNHRGKAIVETLNLLGQRPIVIVHRNISEAIIEVGNRSNVFVIAGDPAQRKTLESADVATAHSVIVLVDYSLGQDADAHSVKVALAVERIQVSVHTVVELTDIRNKAHFKWTKVDELVCDEEISIKMIAQGIRQVVSSRYDNDASGMSDQTLLINTYQQLVRPEKGGTQIFRVDLPWSEACQLTFLDILQRGACSGVLPLALAGYEKHEIAARPGQSAWTSWKIEVRANLPAAAKLRTLWPIWPEGDYPLGVLLLARSLEEAQRVMEA